MNVREEAEKLKSKGYNEDDANARICQDIILKGIAASGLSRSVTIKGGVVMRNISHNDRRGRPRTPIWISSNTLFPMTQLLNSYER